MKWLSSSLAAMVALLVSTATASPLPQAQDRMVVYKLRIASRSDVFLDGKYLSLRQSTVGVYSDSRPVQFYAREGPNRGLVELHTYPIGIVDSVLALVGSDGLLAFTDVSNPAAVTYPEGTQADWTSFNLTGGGGPEDRGGDPRSKLTYAASRTGRWVAFPDQSGYGGGSGEWKITWLEGTAWVTQDYMPVEIIYEMATQRDIGV